MRVISHFLLVIFWSFGGNPVVPFKSNVSSIRSNWHPAVNNDGLAAHGVLPSSPDCWLHALQTINADSTKTADACNWMTTMHQKIMALELARCHVYDLGRSLFDESSSNYQPSTCSKENYRENITKCLTLLTPSAETAYTHFLTYINQLCTRLSREIVMDQFYKSSIQLAQASRRAEHQIKEILKHQDVLWEAWKEREQEAVLFHHQFKHDVYQERVNWAKESSLLRSQWHQEQEELMLNQHLTHRNQLNELARQSDQLKRQFEELVSLSDTIARANGSIQPWSVTLQSLYFIAQSAYHLLKWTLHMAGNCSLTYIFTVPRCLRWLRRYLLSMAVIGYALEAGLIMSHETFLKGDTQALAQQKMETSDTVRNLMAVFEIIFYVMGVLISPCWWDGDEESSVRAQFPSRCSRDIEMVSDRNDKQITEEQRQASPRPPQDSFRSFDRTYTYTTTHPPMMAPPPIWAAMHQQRHHAATLEHFQHHFPPFLMNGEYYFGPNPASMFADCGQPTNVPLLGPFQHHEGLTTPCLPQGPSGPGGLENNTSLLVQKRLHSSGDQEGNEEPDPKRQRPLLDDDNSSASGTQMLEEDTKNSEATSSKSLLCVPGG